MATENSDRRQEYQTLLAQAPQAIVGQDVTEALRLCQRAVELAETDGEKADALCLVGRCYGTMGDFELAGATLNEAMRLAEACPDVLARVMLQMGTVRWQQGQLDAAKQYLSQAVAELRHQNNIPTSLRAMSNLGMVLHTRGEYQKAILTLKDTLELAENVGNWLVLMINLSNVGECYQDLGDLATARDMHERALRVSQEHNLDSSATIDTMRNLGVDLLGIGQVAEGLALIQQSLEQARAVHRRDLELQCMTSLGEAYLVQGMCSEAEQMANELVQASSHVPIRLAAARWLLGRCHLARNETQPAFMLLEKGLIDAQSSYSKIWILRLHAALSQITAQPALAQVHRRIAAELVEQIADSLEDKALRTTFLQSPLARMVAD